MKLTLKKRFQNLADQISFPIFFYIYESGKLIGANEQARWLIGEETKNIKQIWKDTAKRRIPDKTLLDGRFFFPGELIENKGYFLRVDMELCVFQIDHEHIVIVLLEQSYKNAFGEEKSIHIPRIIWKDKRMRIRGQNAVSRKMAEQSVKVEPGYAAENSYGEEVLKKVFTLEERVIEEQLESYGVLQQVKIEAGKKGFARLNRIALINRNGNSIGILVIYEILQEREESRNELCWLLRQNAAMEECLKESKKVAYSICENRNGSVDYLSAGIEQFGYQPGEFYSGETGWLDIVYKEDRKLLQKRERQIGVFEYRIYTKEGGLVSIYDKINGYTVYRGMVYRQGIIWKIEDDKNREKEGNEEWEL